MSELRAGGGTQRARDFLESVIGFATTPAAVVPSQDRPTKLGTVDPFYSGVGLPKVLFDGETLMGVRGYQYVGGRPAAGARVFLIPQGTGYVIAGTLGGGGAPDSGDVDLSTYALSGTLSGVKSGRWASVSGAVDTDVPIGTTTTDVTNALPAEWRPSGNRWGSAWSSGYSASALIRAAGTIAIANRNVAAWTGQIQFTIVYPLATP